MLESALVFAAASVVAAQATFVSESPRLDGVLNEPVWGVTPVATAFTQSEPNPGQAASQETEVFVVYTSTHLYIGARLFDTDPERIVAREYRRDAELDAEDQFEVFLDTFQDGRNAFYFATNAVGARRDGLVRGEGAALNFEWDGVWDVVSRRNEDGWSLEMEIPFNTLRFNRGSRDGWGVNFGRQVARTREETYWAPISPDWGFNAKYRVSEYRTLTGLDSAQPGGRVKLKPYALAGANRDFELDEGTDKDATVGLDAKIALSSTLNLDITVNTDFAQVESDQEQVNLTRFPLFFPEKREFFLENAGLFQLGEAVRPFEPPGTLLFFSRRLGLSDDGDELPILGGARLTGRLGRTELGVFHIVSERTELEDSTVPQTSYSAFRIKQDVLSRSSVGGMFLNKSPADEGPSNQVAAADYNFAFSETASVGGFLAQSRTPGLERAQHAGGVELQWTTDRASFLGGFTDIGEDFNSEMGFVPRTGIRKMRAGASWSPRPKSGPIRQVFLGTDLSYIADRDGNLQTQASNFGPFFIFKNGSFAFVNVSNEAEGLTESFEIRDEVEIPIGEYRYNRFNLGYNGDRSRRLAANVFFGDGGFFNGTLRTLFLGIDVKPQDRVRLNFGYGRNEVDLPIDDGTFKTNLLIARGVVAFSPRAFVRALVQYNDDSDEVLTNLLFRYNYRPGSDFFVVYNEDRDTAGTGAFLKVRELLIKLTFYAVPF